ncbi:MAG: hypothetical protein IJZ09_03865 [Tidjanibacter sp.]|nr:hypothetical protein [Tidjanibacter sp.]
MKIKQLLLAAAAMVFAVACNELPDEPVKPTPEVQIGVMPMEVSYVAAGGEQTVSVVAKGAWTATPDAEWIKVEPASGEAGTVSVKIYAEKNATTEAREGKVVFAVGEEKAEVAVAQQAGEPAGSEVWGLAGSHQGWSPADATAMEYADGYYFQKGLEFEAGTEFKFVKDNAWAVCRGYEGKKPIVANYYYPVQQSVGGNIKVAAEGTYDVYLNEATDTFYLMEAGKLPAEAKDSSELEEAEVPEDAKGMRIVGTHNGWNKDGDDVNMTLENGLWGYKGLEFTAAGEFKFVQNRSDWYGVAADTEIVVNHFYAVAGENIKVAAGTYDLYISEDATKFYVMAAGVAPSEAKDGAAGGEEGAATASISNVQVAEGPMGKMIVYYVSTANVVKASTLVTATSNVDETFTAEFVLSEMGGWPLDPETQLNQADVEMSHMRLNPETEYTIFLAYEDAAGKKDMVTATITTPKEAANYDCYATSLLVEKDDLYEETWITFTDEQSGYILQVFVNTLGNIENDSIWFEGEEEGAEVYVTSATVYDLEWNKLDECVAGEFCAESDFVGAWMNTEAGGQAVFRYMGSLYGNGGSEGGEGGEEGSNIEFVIASGKFSQDVDKYGPTIWLLELLSTNNEKATLGIDIMATVPAPINGTFPVGSYGLATTPIVIADLSNYENPETLANYMFYPDGKEEHALQIQSGYDGVNADSDVNIISGTLALFDMANYVEAGTITFTHSGTLALYAEEGGNEAEELEVLEFVINPDAGLAGELYNTVNLLETIGMPGWQFYFGTSNGDTALMSFLEMTNAGYVPGALPSGTDYLLLNNPSQSCVIAIPGYTEFNIGGKYYEAVQPETATDANGRPYGVNVVTMMPDMDINMITFYIPVMDKEGNMYVVDGCYQGILNYPANSKPTQQLDLDVYSLTNFNAVLEGNMAVLTARSNNGVLTLTISNWGEPFADEEGVLYVAGDNLLQASWVLDDGFDYGVYEMVESEEANGRMVLTTTDEFGVYTMTFSSRAPLTLEGEDRNFELASEFTVTIDGLMKAPASDSNEISNVMFMPYADSNYVIYATYGENMIQVECWNAEAGKLDVVEGTFTIAPDAGYNGTNYAIAGTQDNFDGDGVGSYILDAEFGLVDIINAGSMTTTDNGDGTWTIVFDLSCENGETFKGEWTGEVQYLG